MMRNRMSKWIVGLAASTVLAGTGVALADEPKRGGELRVGHPSKAPGFDAMVVRGVTGIVPTLNTLIWGPAFDVDAQGEYQPRYGVSLTPSDGGKTWTWKLREGVKYSDGTPFDAQTIVDHLNRFRHTKKRNPLYRFLLPYEEVTAIDPTTMEVKLKFPWGSYEPYARGRYTAWAGAIMPAAHVEKMGKDLNKNPLGFGPYRVASWEKGDKIVLDRNPHYWAPETQYLDKISIQHIPGSEENYAALKSGDIDLFHTRIGRIALDAKKEGRFQVVETLDAGTTVTLINTRKEALSDVRVRRALAHAYDRETVNNVLNAGLRQPSQDIFGPSSKWYCPNTGYPEYDPEKAKALLKEYGKPVDITLQVGTSRIGVEYGQLMQDMFAKVGIQTTVRRVPGGPQYVKAVFKGDYDLAAWRQPGTSDPDGVIYWSHHSKNKTNRHKYGTERMDAAIETGRSSLDFETRKAAYCVVAEELAKGVPMLYGFHETHWVIADKAVRDIPPSHRGVLHLAKVWLDR